MNERFVNACANTRGRADAVLRGHRLAAAVAAVAVSSALLGVVVSLFGHQSAMPWLAPTPANAVRHAACDRVPGRAERAACVRQVVAAVQAVPPERVAAAASPVP